MPTDANNYMQTFNEFQNYVAEGKDVNLSAQNVSNESKHKYDVK